MRDKIQPTGERTKSSERRRSRKRPLSNFSLSGDLILQKRSVHEIDMVSVLSKHDDFGMTGLLLHVGACKETYSGLL